MKWPGPQQVPGRVTSGAEDLDPHALDEIELAVDAGGPPHPEAVDPSGLPIAVAEVRRAAGGVRRLYAAREREHREESEHHELPHVSLPGEDEIPQDRMSPTTRPPRRCAALPCRARIGRRL